jgi:hypothetical protein
MKSNYFLIICFILLLLPFAYLLVRLTTSAFFKSLKEYKNKGEENDSK